MKVSELVSIRTGYQFRGRIHQDPQGTHRVIQIRDFDEDFQLDPSRMMRVTPAGDVTPHLALVGDVLFLSRGQRSFAWAVTEPLADSFVSGYFYILRRRKHNAICPGYLAWYINQGPFTERLRGVRKGSHMPLVAKADLAKIPVALPPIKVQEKILAVDRLHRRERRLVAKISAKQRLLVELKCLAATCQ